MAPANNNSKNTTHIDLSIQISLNGLSFCILQRENNTIQELKHFSFEKKLTPFEVLDYLKVLFQKEDALKQSFQSVLLIHNNELATLVPNSLFNEDSLADYLKFNTKILKSDFIAFDRIKSNDSVNVYVPYVNINNFIYDTFGTFTYKHFSTILIENVLALSQANKKQVYAHLGIGRFEILVVENNKLVLYNTFEFNSKEDFIYYILFTFEQLELDPEKHHLFLLGNIEKDNALFSIAYKYVRNVSLGKRTMQFQFTASETAKEHSNFILTNSF